MLDDLFSCRFPMDFSKDWLMLRLKIWTVNDAAGRKSRVRQLSRFLVSY